MIPFKSGGQWVWLGGPALAKARKKANKPEPKPTFRIIIRRPDGTQRVKTWQ